MIKNNSQVLKKNNSDKFIIENEELDLFIDEAEGITITCEINNISNIKIRNIVTLKKANIILELYNSSVTKIEITNLLNIKKINLIESLSLNLRENQEVLIKNNPILLFDNRIIFVEPKEQTKLIVEDDYFKIIPNSKITISLIKNEDATDIAPFSFNNKPNLTLIFKNTNLNVQKIRLENCHLKINTEVEQFSNLILTNCSLELITKEQINYINIDLDEYTFQSIKYNKLINKIGHLKIISKKEKVTIEDIVLSKIFDYNPSITQLIITLLMMILLGSIIFNQKEMAPADSINTQLYISNIIKKNHPELNIESNEGWAYPEGYQNFSPILYSLDLSLPIIDIGQTKSWVPIFDIKRKYVDIYFYVIKIFGKIFWFLIIYKILKKWDVRNE